MRERRVIKIAEYRGCGCEIHGFIVMGIRKLLRLRLMALHAGLSTDKLGFGMLG
jgi:hypothetical protein